MTCYSCFKERFSRVSMGPMVPTPKRKVGMRVPRPLVPAPKRQVGMRVPPPLKKDLTERAKNLFNTIQEDVARLEATLAAKAWGAENPPEDCQKDMVAAKPQAAQEMDMAVKGEKASAWVQSRHTEDLAHLEATLAAMARQAANPPRLPEDCKKDAVAAAAKPQAAAAQEMDMAVKGEEAWVQSPKTEETAVPRSPSGNSASPSRSDWGWDWNDWKWTSRMWTDCSDIYKYNHTHTDWTGWSEWSDSDWGDWSSMAQPVPAGPAAKDEDSEMEEVFVDKDEDSMEEVFVDLDLPEEFCELTHIAA